ncbi:MAG TPA: glycosyltransferase family 4 protein [Candidatus Limnocylindria bacterium]|nr:glycosyltransferase family 4 protein [Candidatus Limnocylindria bacterium]
MTSAGSTMQILFVATGAPWPPNSGGQIRMLSQLRVLASLPEVARIRLFSLSEDRDRARHRDELARSLPGLDVADPVFHPIHLFKHPRYVPRVAWLRAVRGVPYVAAKWDSAAVRSALQRELEGQRFDVVWLGSLGAARYLPLVRSSQPTARVVLDEHNVESDIWAQFAARQHGVRKMVAEAETRAARRFERDALRAVDAVAAISPDDARVYRELAGVEARYLPQVVPFTRRRDPATPPPPRLCYVGTLSWHPNVRGLEWFCREVWPGVRERLPEATLDIAGTGLPTDGRGVPVVPEGWRGAGIRVAGFVADLVPLYEGSAAMVAPILGGGGIRIKLLEAFRHGVPVVTTPDGAAGLPIESGREAFIEREPGAFAARVVEVATSGARQASLREAAYAFLERHHSRGSAEAVVRALLGLDAGAEVPSGQRGQMRAVELPIGGRRAGVVAYERQA